MCAYIISSAHTIISLIDRVIKILRGFQTPNHISRYINFVCSIQVIKYRLSCRVCVGGSMFIVIDNNGKTTSTEKADVPASSFSLKL